MLLREESSWADSPADLLGGIQLILKTEKHPQCIQ